VSLQSPFLFTVCQVGAEPALKKEVARDFPQLKFAYSRPGFVTFKSAEPLSVESDFQLVFARLSGLSMPKIASIPDFVKTLQSLNLSGPICVHVFERDQHIPGEEPKGFTSGGWSGPAIEELRAQQGSLSLEINRPAQAGELVVNLILLGPQEYWMGVHRARAGLSFYPGANPGVTQPKEAPSRAFVKLEEGLLWSKAPLQAKDLAVEFGSAPGGASYSLLKRGLRVIGVDPGKMDPRILEEKNYRHISKTVATVFPPELSQSVQWLLVDMNVKPSVSLFAVDRFAVAFKSSLQGVLLTIKLNEWKMADEIPSMFEHVRSMGMSRVKATQLPSNGQEIFIAGFTRQALL
jgi:23S rRNA (cytidine2498-2'-O)-methyltransferase